MAFCFVVGVHYFNVLARFLTFPASYILAKLLGCSPAILFACFLQFYVLTSLLSYEHSSNILACCLALLLGSVHLAVSLLVFLLLFCNRVSKLPAFLHIAFFRLACSPCFVSCKHSLNMRTWLLAFLVGSILGIGLPAFCGIHCAHCFDFFQVSCFLS